MVNKVLKVMIKNSRAKIVNCLTSSNLRAKGCENKFTRTDRGLGAERTIEVVLSRLYKPLQLEIDGYFKEIGGTPVTRQAFSKSRSFMNPDYVRSFFDDCVTIIVGEDDSPGTYKGMRLIAIDGSTLALENSNELIREFGCSGSKKDAATAQCSIAFDPLNKVIYDGQIDKYTIGERDIAKRHVERLNELGLQGSLLLFDRGYPSAEFIAYLLDNGYQFLMRVKSKWNLEVDAVQTQDRFEFWCDSKHYEFRAIKVTLENGTTETLLTSLNQKQLPAAKAAEIYFKRWAVEGAFDLLKSRLQLENFSGKTKATVLQDFWATLYIGNFVAVSAACADEIIHENDEEKNLKYERFADRGRVVSKFRAIFIELLSNCDDEGLEDMAEELIADCAKYPVSKVDGRTAPRKPPRCKRFHGNRKSVV